MTPFLLIASLPLRAKLTLGLVVGIVLAVVVAAFAIDQYTRAIQPTTNLIINTLSQERADALTAQVSQQLGIVQQVATNPLNVSYFTTLLKDNLNASARQRIEQGFQQVLNVDPNIRGMRFVSATGEILVSNPAISRDSDADEAYFKTLKNQPIANDAGATLVSRVGTPDTTNFEFSVAAVTGDQLLGFVVGTVNPAGSINTASSLYDALRVVSPSSGIVTFYLVDKQGTILSPVIRPLSNPASAATAKRLAEQPFTQPTEYTSPLAGAAVIGLTTPIPVLNMTLVAETHAIQFAGGNESGRFIGQILGILLIGVLALILVALFWELTLASPVQRVLNMAASSVSRSSTPGLRPVRQRDEVGRLYTIFSSLDSQLHQDITALEARIADRTRDVEATRDIGQISSSLRDLDVLLPRVVTLICERFQAIYHAQIFLTDNNQRFAVLRASTGETGEQLLARGHRLAIGSQSIVGQAAATGRPMVAQDTPTNPIHRVNDLLPDTRAELALPLSLGAELLGVLDLQSTRSNAFTEADIRLFQTIADQVSIAIANSRLFEQLNIRVNEIESLNRQLIRDGWRDYATARRRALPTAYSGMNSANGQRGLAGWSELQTEAARTGQVAIHMDVDMVTLAVPISLRGEVLGTVEWDMPRETYNENTRQLAEELATRLAITADNARLFEQSQRLAERERLINEVASKLTQQADVSQILKIAVREVGLALRVPQTSIRLSTNRDVQPAPLND